MARNPADFNHPGPKGIAMVSNQAACPLCYQPIRVPTHATEVQAFAKHFNGECRGRAKRPQ